jgi:hypothetical protein
VRRNMHATIAIHGHTEDGMHLASEVNHLSGPTNRARYGDCRGERDLDLSNDFRVTDRRRK